MLSYFHPQFNLKSFIDSNLDQFMSKATDLAFEQNAPMTEKKFVVWKPNEMKQYPSKAWAKQTLMFLVISTPWASVFLFGDEMSTLEMCTFIVKVLKYKTVLDFHMTESYLKYN